MNNLLHVPMLMLSIGRWSMVVSMAGVGVNGDGVVAGRQAGWPAGTSSLFILNNTRIFNTWDDRSMA